MSESAAVVPAAHAEHVLCVARHLIFPDGAWHGLVSTGLERVLRTIRAASDYRPRVHVEDDPNQQQVIPYCVVQQSDGTYLLTRRLRRSSERRLHNLYSIGVGGHVNPGDGQDGDPVAGGLRREWLEEVICPAPANARLVALLNDDSTPVSAVHLGLVFIIEAPVEAAVTVRETDKLEGQRLTLDGMRHHYPVMESWSQLTFDALDRGDIDLHRPSPMTLDLPPAP